MVVRCESTWLDFDLAGRSPRKRLTELLEQFGTTPTFLRPDEEPVPGPGPRLWIEGLYPLMGAEELSHFLSLARALGVAAWTGPRRRHGLVYQANAAGSPQGFEALARSSATHHEQPLPAPLHAPSDLASLSRSAFAREALRVSNAGAILLCFDQTFIDADVTVGAGTTIAPNVTLSGRTTIGRLARIETGAVIRDAVLGDSVQVKAYSVIEGATLGKGAAVGPFAHLRPGTELGEDVRIGNFVETKKVVMGRGSKANHLSYLGDAKIGADCNIGAGTITCNYDGKNKSETVLGDRVFIGSDSQLVAPLTIGDDVYVGAGSTIVRHVPAGALALSRCPQVIKPDQTVRLREKAQLKYEAEHPSKNSTGGS